MSERRFHIPVLSLKEAVDILDIALKISGRERRIPGEVLAERLGHSPTSSTYIRKLYSLKNYGLLSFKIKRERIGERTKITVEYCEITDLAVKILNPLNEDERIEALLNAFLNAYIFRELYEKYKGTFLPSEDLFKALLVREYGLSEDEARRLYVLFLESARYVGILREEAQGFRLCSREDLLKERKVEKKEVVSPPQSLISEAGLLAPSKSEEFEKLITDDFLFFVRKSSNAIEAAKKMFEIWIESLNIKYGKKKRLINFVSVDGVKSDDYRAMT